MNKLFPMNRKTNILRTKDYFLSKFFVFFEQLKSDLSVKVPFAGTRLMLEVTTT